MNYQDEILEQAKTYFKENPTHHAADFLKNVYDLDCDVIKAEIQADRDKKFNEVINLLTRELSK